jgi:hypothetical protein
VLNIIGTMHVTGPVLQGSTATNVTTSYGVSGDELRRLVAALRGLLAEVNLPEDDREEIEADLGMIEEEAATGQPRSQRIRPLLRRLQVALTRRTRRRRGWSKGGSYPADRRSSTRHYRVSWSG